MLSFARALDRSRGQLRGITGKSCRRVSGMPGNGGKQISLKMGFPVQILVRKVVMFKVLGW